MLWHQLSIDCCAFEQRVPAPDLQSTRPVSLWTPTRPRRLLLSISRRRVSTSCPTKAGNGLQVLDVTESRIYHLHRRAGGSGKQLLQSFDAPVPVATVYNGVTSLPQIPFDPEEGRACCTVFLLTPSVATHVS